MHNLRKDRKINNINLRKSKSTTITNKKLVNMPAVENFEFIPSTSEGLQNTAVNKRIADVQQGSSRPSLMDAPL